MIQGIDCNIRFRNLTYHLRTEDLGRPRSLVRSMIWLGGLLLDSIDGPYETLPDQSEREIRRHLLAHHQGVIRQVLEGRYSAGLTGTAPLDGPALTVSELDPVGSGRRASLMILVRRETSNRPIAGVPVSILLEAGGGVHVQVYRGRTDPRGFHLAEFDVPGVSEPEAALVVEVDTPLGPVEARLPFGASGAADLPEVEPDEVEPGVGEPAAAREQGRLDIIISELTPPAAGGEASLMILVRQHASNRPVADAAVRILHPAGSAQATTIHQGKTDRRGFHLAEFRVPPSPHPETSILVHAASPHGDTQAVIPVAPI